MRPATINGDAALVVGEMTLQMGTLNYNIILISDRGHVRRQLTLAFLLNSVSESRRWMLFIQLHLCSLLYLLPFQRHYPPGGIEKGESEMEG